MSYYKYLILLFYLLVGNVGKAQQIAIEGYEIKKGGYIEYNFGKFAKGKKQLLVLVIKNEGQSPLELKPLELSCDCLQAGRLPALPLPPGARTKLKILHKAKDIGAFSLFAKLDSNSKENAELWIRLNGELTAKN